MNVDDDNRTMTSYIWDGSVTLNLSENTPGIITTYYYVMLWKVL